MGNVELIKGCIEEMRPLIQQDGGDIEFVSFEHDIVTIRFLGACTSCPMSQYTLTLGIEERLVTAFPEIKKVVAVSS